ncbi:hypothetical protein GQ42DRAFT_151902 [Ramicandelaber brevisporus]|nr:hypothetical protein GQ42DRAFT_151902 [Ramicandelaber brevisporus]
MNSLELAPNVLPVFSHVADGREANWMRLGYAEPPTPTRPAITATAWGSGGIPEMVTHFSDDVISFGIALVHNQYPVLFAHINLEHVSGVRRAHARVHFREIVKVFEQHGIRYSMIIEKAADITEGKLAEPISKDAEVANQRKSPVIVTVNSGNSSSGAGAGSLTPVSMVALGDDHMPAVDNVAAAISQYVSPATPHDSAAAISSGNQDSPPIEDGYDEDDGAAELDSPVMPIASEVYVTLSTEPISAVQTSVTPTTPVPAIQPTSGEDEQHEDEDDDEDKQREPSAIKSPTMSEIVEAKVQRETEKRAMLRAQVSKEEQTGHSVVETGYLTIQGGNAGHLWKRRWFTRRGNVLYLYLNETSASPSTAIDLSEVIGNVEDAQEEVLMPNSIQLVVSGLENAPYYMYFDTAVMKQQIMSDILGARSPVA